jgi:hypothetical protein
MPEPFHKRFDIEVNARRRFVNRIRIGTETAAKGAKEQFYFDELWR